MSGQLLKAGAVSLWFEREGAGRDPLLMINGLGHAIWAWTGLRTRLSEAADLLMFENRGAGRSDKPAGPYTMGMLADDAANLMQAAGVARADVLGHSMGGYIAITLALRHPQRVRSLVLLSTSCGGPDTKSVPEETLKAWALSGSMPAADYARVSMPYSFAPGWEQRNAREFEEWVQRRLQFPTPPAAWLSQYQACAEYVSKGVDVTAIQVPALVIHGEQDRVVPHHNGALLAQRLPQSKFVSLPGSGHLPFIEEPARVAQLIREHLASRA